MSAPSGERVRVTLERIQILEKKDPVFERFGEFRFHARVSSRNGGGIVRETDIPERGFYRISSLPGENVLALDVLLFEDWVEDHLEVELTGVEVDLVTRDDPLNPYRRVLTGSPRSWVGRYGPGDEGLESEDLGDWRVWYRVDAL